MDGLDWTHPIMPMPKYITTDEQSSLGHVFLRIIPASREIFVPSGQWLLLHGVVTAAGQRSQLYSNFVF